MLYHLLLQCAHLLAVHISYHRPHEVAAIAVVLQVAKLRVLAYPIFPNVLGLAVAFAKHIGWRPKAGVMARSALTRVPRAEQQQQPIGSSAQAAAAASDSVHDGRDAASKVAAAVGAGTAAGSGRSASTTRAAARQRSSAVGCPRGVSRSVSSTEVTDMKGAAPAASGYSQGSQQQQLVAEHGCSGCTTAAAAGASLFYEDDDEVGPEMPDAVADMLTDVQSGRLAAATLILQATEQTVRVAAE